MKYPLGISHFLEELANLSHLFPPFLFIDHWFSLSCISLLFFGSLHSHGCISFSILSFTFLFTAICKASSDNHFAFLHFFFLGVVLITACCTNHKPPSIVLQALCLSDLIHWIYLSIPLNNCKEFDLGHAWMVQWFCLLSSIEVWILQ